MQTSSQIYRAPGQTDLPPARIHKLSPSPAQGGRGRQGWVLERHGWRYDCVPSLSRPLILKSHADNFQRRL